jgi:chromosomal replication initiation ATPase DnaA
VSYATTYQTRYTPAQLEQAATIRAIRERQKSAMMERLKREREKLEAAEAEKRAIAEAARKEKARIAAIHMELQANILKARERLNLDEGKRGGGVKNGGISQRTLTQALRRIARAYDVVDREVLGQSRSNRLPIARAHLMVLLCIENPYASIAAIARAMGRDHTTVLHALRTYNAHFGANVRNVKPEQDRKTVAQFREIHLPSEQPLDVTEQQREAA